MAKQEIDYRAMDAEQVLAAMAASVNGAEHRMADHIKAEFRKVHPTLQQAMVRSIVRPILEALADEPHPDARNERAVQFAVKALVATENTYLPTI